MVLKELIFNSFHFGLVVALKELICNSFHFWWVWWSKNEFLPVSTLGGCDGLDRTDF